jgi:hypothetical protein
VALCLERVLACIRAGMVISGEAAWRRLAARGAERLSPLTSATGSPPAKHTKGRYSAAAQDALDIAQLLPNGVGENLF